VWLLGRLRRAIRYGYFHINTCYMMLERDEWEGEIPMYQKHPRIISRKSPHRTRIRIHHNRIPPHRNIPYSLCPIPHWRVGWRAVDDLELVAVHVPWVGTRVEIIDYYFDTIIYTLVGERVK
jgi:hypothetical protein